MQFLCFYMQKMQIFFHIPEVKTFLNKTYYLLLKFGWKNVKKYAFENNLSNLTHFFFNDPKCKCQEKIWT